MSVSSKELGFLYGYVIGGLAFFILVVTYGTYCSYGVFFKSVLDEFGWIRVIPSGTYSLSLPLSGVLDIVMGRLNDRVGPRVVIAAPGLLLGVSFFTNVTVEYP